MADNIFNSTVASVNNSNIYSGKFVSKIDLHDYNFDNDLAPFVDATRQRITKEIQETIDFSIEGASILCERGIEELVEKRVREAVSQAMQIVICNLNSMHSRAGSQIPFSSLNLGVPLSEDAAIVCEELLKAYEGFVARLNQAIARLTKKGE